jgi:hypothetical protein
MIEELDDLTLVYMYGAKNGRDSMKDEIERLRASLRSIESVGAQYSVESGPAYAMRNIALAALEWEKTDV